MNAIVHRDYSAEGSGIEIFIFNDRMEIASPGALLSDVPLEALRRREKIHQSRNSYIARCLRELGYVREMGEGIPRIFEALEVQDLVPPELVATPHSFLLTLHHRSIFSPKDRAWLESYKGIPLSRDEQRVMLLARDREVISPTDIMQLLGIVDTDQYRQLVEKMQWKGLLYSTKSDTQISAEWKRRKKARKRRDIPRLSLRSPVDAVRLLEELLIAVWRTGVPTKVGSVTSLASELSEKSPFRRSPVPSLLALELIDEERRPTARLLDLLARIKQEPAAGVARLAKPIKAGEAGEKEKVQLAREEYELLVSNVDRIVADSKRGDGGVSLYWVHGKLSDQAKAVARRLGSQADFVDFLSRQRDRFDLRWVHNAWYVYRRWGSP